MLHQKNLLSKAAALLLAAAMLGAFASCGKDQKKKETTAVSRTTQRTESVNIVAFEEEDVSSVAEPDGQDETDTFTTTTTTASSRKKTTTQTTTKATAAKTTTTAAPTKATTTTAKATTTAATTKVSPVRDNSYQITAKSVSSKDGSVKYTYPQITGLYDETMQNFYNNLFRADFEEAVKDNELSFFDGAYEVKRKTKDQLSIVFRCGIFYKGAAHPFSYAYAYTIDLATGNTIIPSESVNLNKAAEAILGNSWTLTRSSDGVSKQHIIDYFSQFDESAMKSNISSENTVRVKNTNGKYTVSGNVGCRSYLDANGEIVLILEVSHGLGDYVEVQF